ncbi:MAG TPA: TIGR00725 family protein [Desulfobacteraceae bacterium]|nr:TIGR00725 family protein [Desulfobacteraceae bacterium]HPJ66579.1 TIGR00725 family protein [Desulfobacteraceae bacterium]HPQ28809.1 TIGR00725 family protein [Desulfobacteraceae bacterium]
MKKSCHIGIIGAGACSDIHYQLARKLGFEIGKRGWSVVCGGLGGVMEGSAKGCLEAGSMTIGLLPGLTIESANPYIQVPIPTGLGEGRNILVVRASHVLVAIGGGYGTLSEIAFALKTGKPVIGLETWKNIEGIQYVSDCYEAVIQVERFLEKGLSL